MSEVWKSATYKIVHRMRMAGNKPGLIAEWKAGLEAWAASQPPTREVQALRSWLPLLAVRPFYTAAELAPLMPALAAYLGFKPLRAPRSAARMANRLHFVGLPVLQNSDGGEGFVNPTTGRYDTFFICERIHFWRKRVVSQEEFEREFFS